jgi:ABC-type multidrug transport system fused ATPase/permease subunit
MRIIYYVSFINSCILSWIFLIIFFEGAINRWQTMRTDFISATVVLLAGLAVIFGNGISPGWAGLILLYSSQFSEALLWVIRTHADMEMSLNSVERCIEYSEVEQEPARIVDHYRPSPNVKF